MPTIKPATTRTLISRLHLRGDDIEAARTWLATEGNVPTKARCAASVVFVREGSRGPETLMCHHGSRFGTLGFPGGAAEYEEAEAIDWIGPSPEQWARQLGLEDVHSARRLVVTALRKAFERAGILLAGPDNGSTVDVSAPEWMAHRRSLADQDLTFADLLARRGLALRTDLLYPGVKWLSPEFVHRRFRHFFFVATMPEAQRSSPLLDTSSWSGWVNPARCLKTWDETTLGDALGFEDTVGRRCEELFGPECETLLRKFAVPRSCIALLVRERTMASVHPQLSVEDDELWLDNYVVR